jgi:HCO3- transporter family
LLCTLFALFFPDQNISSILVSREDSKLTEGRGYYLGLFIMCVIIAVQSLLGMLWTHAALPQSPLHAGVADVEEYEGDRHRYERVFKASEMRFTGLVRPILIVRSFCSLRQSAIPRSPCCIASSCTWASRSWTPT